jgi:cell division protein FtsL
MGAVSIVTSPPRHQRFRETARIGMRLSRQIFLSLWQAPVLITFGLVALVAVSATGVVYASHENRVLFNELSNLQAERDSYQREWSQLLLEQSALSALSRVEQFAVKEFNMAVPGRDDIVIVPVGGKYQRVTQ